MIKPIAWLTALFFACVNLGLGQSNLDLEDGNLVIHERDPDVQIISEGAATLGWINDNFVISPYLGLVNAIALKATSTGPRIGIGTSANEDDRLVIEHTSSAGLDRSPHLNLLETATNGFARMTFSEANQTRHWMISGKAGSDNPAMRFQYYNNGSYNRVLSLRGLQKRVGINDGSPEFTLDIHHADNGLSGGLNLRNDDSGDAWHFFTNSEEGDLLIFKNGNLKASIAAATGNYVPLSDLRVKEDIQPLPPVKARFMQLRPKQYRYQDQERMAYGLIAQEVAKIFPHAVHSISYHQGEEYLGISYSTFIPILIDVIQNLQIQLDQKTKDLDQLNERLNRLEQQLQE